ncbi:unnamed protein product [Bursaphelenchus okinawaensis]|nr:unnamed protein product [Bursaphelenchus okinawaensis]CAG9077605.1 unnamed protein product [Bursaphelenchus okinawaensis]
MRAVNYFTEAVLQGLRGGIGWPQSDEEAKLIGQKFAIKGGNRFFAGAVDGTLIEVVAPLQSRLTFVTRHHTTCINAVIVADTDMVIRYFWAGAGGSKHDDAVLRISSLQRAFDAGFRPFPGAVLIADSGYGDRSWLLAYRQNHPPAYENLYQ